MTVINLTKLVERNTLFGYLVNPVNGNTRAVMLASIGSQLNASKLESMLGVQRLIPPSAMTCYRVGSVCLRRKSCHKLSTRSQGRIAKVNQSLANDLFETRYCKC